MIERVVRDGTVVANGRVHRVFPVAVSQSEGEALREWIRREGANHTIEIGLGYGVSTLYVCEGLIANAGRTARHVAIDPFEITTYGSCGLGLLDEAGVAGLVEHCADESQIALPRFLAEGRTFDLAFVDGNHRFDRVFLDLTYLGRLVRPGGIVFLDDYQLPAVARAVSFYLSNRDWTLEEVSPQSEFHQWVVVRTSRGPDRPAYDDFVDF